MLSGNPRAGGRGTVIGALFRGHTR